MYVCLHRSVALDILSTVFWRTRKSLPLDIAFNMTKAILLLLMDDEDEIREKCAHKVHCKFSPGRQRNSQTQIFHPYYIQETFLENLGSIFPALNRVEVLTIIALLAIEDDEGQNGLEENIADLKVFDKSEVNIFSESYVVRRKCREVLKTHEQLSSDVIESMKNFGRNKNAFVTSSD